MEGMADRRDFVKVPLAEIKSNGAISFCVQLENEK